MTIDKIEYYMNPVYFNHWVNLSQSEIYSLETKNFYLKNALEKLTYEIDHQILSGIEYIAEQNLLNHLLN